VAAYWLPETKGVSLGCVSCSNLMGRSARPLKSD
jgi:hypothetical protein